MIADTVPASVPRLPLLSVLTDCENERSHHCDPTRFEVLLMKIFMSY